MTLHTLSLLASLDFSQWKTSVSRYATMRARLLASLRGFYEVLDTPNHFLTAAEAARGKELGMSFLRDYNNLSHAAVTRGELRWQMTMKFHYFAHALDQLVWANPKHASTYRGESFVGKVSKVALSASYVKANLCSGGPADAETPSRQGLYE